MPQAQTPSFMNRHKFFIFVVAVLAAMAALGIGLDRYQRSQIREEKAAFAQAEQDIDELSAKIIAATGEPLKVEKDKFCSRPNNKAGDGGLSCTVEATHFYGVESTDDANKLRNLISPIIETVWGSSLKSEDHNLASESEFQTFQEDNYDPKSSYQRKQSEYQQSGQVKCISDEILYITVKPPYDDYPQNGSKFIYSTRINCDGTAKLGHFAEE
jgi:hypothetical protein